MIWYTYNTLYLWLPYPRKARVLKSKLRHKLVFGTEIWFCKPLEQWYIPWKTCIRYPLSTCSLIVIVKSHECQTKASKATLKSGILRTPPLFFFLGYDGYGSRTTKVWPSFWWRFFLSWDHCSCFPQSLVKSIDSPLVFG